MRSKVKLLFIMILLMIPITVKAADCAGKKVVACNAAAVLGQGCSWSNGQCYNKYAVTFFDGSKSLKSTSCLTATTSCQVSVPEAPAKDSYKFLGWSMTLDCETIVLTASTKTANVTKPTNFYTCYRKATASSGSSSTNNNSTTTQTYRYYIYDGTDSSKKIVTQTNNTCTVQSGMSYCYATVSNAPSRSGKTLIGYSASLDCSSVQQSGYLKVTKDNMVFYACYNDLSKAQTTGCYLCGNSSYGSYKYIQKGESLPSSCSSTPDSNYSYNSSIGACQKVQTKRTAPSDGCYLCGNSSYSDYYYYSRGVELADYCGEQPNASYSFNVSTQKCELNSSNNSGNYNGGSSSNSSTSQFNEWVIVPATKDSNTQETINNYRYAMTDSLYQGDNIVCGDKLYVTTCDSNYCDVTYINNLPVNTTTKVYKNKIHENASGITSYCSSIRRYVKEQTTYQIDYNNSETRVIACGEEVTASYSLGDLCSNGLCQVNYKNQTIYINQNNIVSTKPNCSSTCKSSNKVTGLTGEINSTICYKYQNSKFVEQDLTIKNAVTCDDGYILKYNLISDSDTCQNVTNENVICSKTYNFKCILSSRPSLAVSGGVADRSGKGIVTITGYKNGADSLKGYYISSGKAPNVNSKWEPFNIDTVSSLILSPGTYFVWTINNYNRISYSVLSRVHDSDASTTLSSLKVSANDEEYRIISLDPDDKIAYVEKNVTHKLLNNLIAESPVTDFDSYKTAYEVNVDSSRISVYATLTSTDASYVPGYEPRTVDLDYGRNVILIKIVNKNGRERTYTIIANRIDNRESNNLLKSLTVSKGSISFNPYVSNYDVIVDANTTSVSISGVLDSVKSSFVKGYEPRVVNLEDDVTSAVIKTISEAGIVRSYIITFTKNSINNLDLNNSANLASLSIPGTNLEFDPSILSYSISVEYETVDLPIYAFAESSNAKVDIKGNQNFKIGPNVVEIVVTNDKVKKIYTVYVNRREDGLGIADNTSLSNLTVQGYKINFKPSVLDYVVKIEKEKSLLITATPMDNRSEVYMYGNNDLTSFSTVRVKVIAETGETKIYSIDIQKDAFDIDLEKKIAYGVLGLFGLILLGIVVSNRVKQRKEYLGK